MWVIYFYYFMLNLWKYTILRNTKLKSSSQEKGTSFWITSKYNQKFKTLMTEQEQNVGADNEEQPKVSLPAAEFIEDIETYIAGSTAEEKLKEFGAMLQQYK